MSDGINKVFLFGHLGAEPELRQYDGVSVLNVRLATTRSWLDKEKNKQERTDWHKVTIWGKRGEGLAKVLHKGSKVFIEGNIKNSSYEKDGVKHYTTEIIADDVSLGGGRSNGAYTPAPAAAASISAPPF